MAINLENVWPKTLNISGNYLTFYRIDKALKRETLAMIIKVLSEMVETDHSSFFDQGPQTTNTSLGATTTEGSTIRGGGECQRPHSQGRQRISRCEGEFTQFPTRFSCHDKRNCRCSCRRGNKTFSKKLGKTIKRSMDSRNYKRSKIRIYQESSNPLPIIMYFPKGKTSE